MKPIERRHFLKQAGILTLGGILLPSPFLAACRKETLFDSGNFKGKVIIVGAGAAGLYAASILKSHGIDFQLLEASASHGGRLGKLTGFADYPLDLGAQWLHGKNNILGDLIHKSKTKITRDDSELSYWFNGEMVTKLPKDVYIFEEDDFPDISFADYAHQKGLGEEYDSIIENLAGDQGADASRLSVYWNNKEEENWCSGDEDFKFEATYFDLIDLEIAAAVKDKLIVNAPVSQIDYTENGATVTTLDGTIYEADKVIVTVPITILKKDFIAFNPPLPAEKVTAFSKIGMDAGMKVFLKFSETFYDENCIGGSVCAAYADEKVGKTGNDHVLLAFIMGEQAENLTALGSDELITNALLAELDEMYAGKASATFIASHVENWTTHPYIQGAYSYSTIGMGNAREIAAQPVGKTLFFAGEAMNLNGHHQTVFGAVESGYKAVIDLLKSVEK